MPFLLELIQSPCVIYDIVLTSPKFTIRSTTKVNQLAHTRFPALGADYVYLLRVLIGLLDDLCLLRLAKVITLVLFLQHSIGNRANHITRSPILLRVTSYLFSTFDLQFNAFVPRCCQCSVEARV